jgi:hypothetical protein
MKHEDIRQAFAELNPTKAQSETMWKRLDKIQKAGQPKKAHKNRIARHAAAAAAALLLVACSGAGINAATDGQFFTAIREWVKIPDSSSEIINQAEQMDNIGIEVYTSDILYLDEKLLVFGNLRGLIVYDLSAEEVLGTIDLQAIDCIYFNADTKQTCVVMDGDVLAVFNEENGSPFGNYYTFVLEKTDDLALEPATAGNDPDTIQQYAGLWSAQQENMCDTFDQFCRFDELESIFFGDEKRESVMYSGQSIRWTDAAGGENISFLVLKDESYVMYTYQESTRQFTQTALRLVGTESESAVTEQDATQPEGLPEFIYTGDDEAVAAIISYLREQNRYAIEKTGVWIPEFVIFKEVEKNGETLVFGSFWAENFVQNGTILESTGGGEYPACIHLKKGTSGYEVTDIENAGDGADYSKDIKAFTKGYLGLYSKYMDMDQIKKKRDEALKQNLQSYIQMYGLGIRYYKEFGWDPVDIFEE